MSGRITHDSDICVFREATVSDVPRMLDIFVEGFCSMEGMTVQLLKKGLITKQDQRDFMEVNVRESVRQRLAWLNINKANGKIIYCMTALSGNTTNLPELERFKTQRVRTWLNRELVSRIVKDDYSCNYLFFNYGCKSLREKDYKGMDGKSVNSKGVSQFDFEYALNTIKVYKELIDRGFTHTLSICHGYESAKYSFSVGQQEWAKIPYKDINFEGENPFQEMLSSKAADGSGVPGSFIFSNETTHQMNQFKSFVRDYHQRACKL